MHAFAATVCLSHRGSCLILQVLKDCMKEEKVKGFMKVLVASTAAEGISFLWVLIFFVPYWLKRRPCGWIYHCPVNKHAYHCAFHKHANYKVQKPPSQLRFSLPSIIITITSNEPGNTETHKTDQNPPITNHKSWPFEPVEVKFCFLRGPLRWLTAAKNVIVSWLLNFRIRVFEKRSNKTKRVLDS